MVVIALLDDAAVVHHQDHVGPRIVESRWAITKLVRPRRRGVHRLLDQHLGAGVDRARRLVEDQDRRVGEERPRDRSSCFSPAGLSPASSTTVS